jgi:cystathionine beta-lyase/cystathionine gamma-synthase
MTKISEFFTSLLDIDFGSVLEKLIPEGTLGDAFRKLTGLKSPEQIKIEKQEIKDQIVIEKAEYDKRQGIINDRLDGRNFSELSNRQQTSVQNQRGLKDEAQSRIEELEARLAELEPKAAVMTQTSDSAVNTAEARLASAVNDNRLIVAPANMGGGGGGAAPDMRGGNTTVVNNSSKKTETRVSLIDRTRPEQLHARRFAAGGT